MRLFLWFWYLGGWAASIFKRADLGAQSTYTPWESIKAYLRAHSGQLVFNFFITTALYWEVWTDPSIIARALHSCGQFVLPANWVWVSNINIPLNIFTSAVFGLLSDVLVDYVIAKAVNRFFK